MTGVTLVLLALIALAMGGAGGLLLTLERLLGRRRASPTTG
jgi:hypothetical protein